MTPERWKDIEKLYEDSINLPPDMRARFLAESCSDPEIRREVESLLAQQQNLPSFLERRGLDIAAEIMPRTQRGTLVGRTIDHYEVRAFIGAGGMGEVYRAHDARLARDVALKVLPAQFSEDPERMRRSEREAKLLASLNHPNIAAIYDLEEADGIPCLILEFVAGETLASRLNRGAVSMAEALDISRQIADALETAHEQGIAHRDLKPGNIMISGNGTVKVLDFGIAKMLEPEVATNPPTNIDSAGVALGTPSYMSPEQARARPIDKRTDIWAFGCVLYEMLTGRRPFNGASVTDTLAAIIDRDPDWQALPADTPENIKELLRRCLHKDVRQRLRDIGEARIQIEQATRKREAAIVPHLSRTAPPPAGSSLRYFRWMLPIVTASVVMGILIGGLVFRRPPKAPAVSRLKMPIRPADDLGVSTRQWTRPSQTAMAFSPDGQRVVFSAMQQNKTRLFSRKLEQTDAAPIPGTEGGAGPIFSPDGQSVAFWADNKIKKVSIDGGPVMTLCPTPGVGRGWGAAWAGDTIFFVLPPTGEFFKVSSSGGRTENVSIPKTENGEQFMLPYALPGGKALLLTARKSFDSETARVVSYSLETGKLRTLIEGAADARYVDTGHLVYMKSGILMGVSFDLKKLEVRGDRVALVENVMQAVNMPGTDQETTAGQFAISASGTLLYMTGGAGPNQESTLVLLNRKGEIEEAGLPAAVQSVTSAQPRFSPDMKNVALMRASAFRHGDVWLFDWLGTGLHRVTFTQTNPYAAIWSPDGKRLVFSSDVSGRYNLYIVNADGNSPPNRLTTDNEYLQFASSWNPVSNVIAFMQENLPKTSELWTLRVDDGKRELLLRNSAPGIRLQYPEFSPDGHWMAFVSNESGQNEVYVRAYPNGRDKYKISLDRGNSPIWTKGGREIVYRKNAGDVERFLSVAITSLSPFRSASPQTLFEAPLSLYINTLGIRSWDATPDGQRILLPRVEPSKDKPVTDFEMILNWTQELKQRVPTK